jgi:hypothetical protein
LLFGNILGEVTFVPTAELLPPGEDEPLVKMALPLVDIFLFFGIFAAPPVNFFSDTILVRSAAKSPIVSEIRETKHKLKTGDKKLILAMHKSEKHKTGEDQAIYQARYGPQPESYTRAASLY